MSFWTKPIGQTLAERKGKPYYKPMFFGTTKLGYIELKSDGRITYQARLDNRTDKTKFDAADITAVSIETAEDYVARVSGGRVAGGAIVGGILLGPLGLALGAGGGALARKTHGGTEYLIIELRDGRTVTVEVARKHAIKARELRDAIAPRKRP